MSNYLIKTAESEVKKDKNDRNYKTVTFTEVVTMNTPFGEIIKPTNQSASRKINRYEKSYLNNTEELGYSEFIFNPNKPERGGLFQGSIERRQVSPYDITNSEGTIEANSYTTAVFGDTSSPDFESLVKSAFKSQGHEILEAANATTVEAF